MDPKIESLRSTTFSGRRLTRRQIADIQETVALLPGNSRAELCKTICEHLNWTTARGDYRVGACKRMLEHLEAHGIPALPPRDESKVRRPEGRPVWTPASDPQPELAATLAEIGPVRLELVGDAEGRKLWNAFADRYHYLGYRKPFGSRIRYFIRDRHGRLLGCMLFESSTKTLPCRDAWIGWSDRARGRNRELALCNSRFLVLPWVRVRNLASHALGMAARRLPGDWERIWKCRPVLCETYVEEGRFRGTSYRSANWIRIGEAGARKGKPAKAVHVLRLGGACRRILRGEMPRRKSGRKKPAGRDRRYCGQWRRIAEAATAVAAREDLDWQKRRRVFSTLLIILFVFRLVLGGGRLGYRTALCELWEQCRAAGIALPQEAPPAASSACEAREKLDPGAFKRLHREILSRAGSDGEPLWNGHRIFAVDGSKFNLPAPLAGAGFPAPHPNAHYPQGLASALYRLQTRIPVDVELFRHADERAAACAHLDHAGEGGVIVYDRGCYSFEMLLAHRDRGLDCVFRIQRNANTPFDAFIASGRADRAVDLAPPRDARSLRGRSCRVRLVRYTAADTECVLATTLLDRRKYSIQALSDLYHARWGIEELYKAGKSLSVEFHARTERGVRQELYAAFTLVALTRMFANRSAEEINLGAGDRPEMQPNFRNAMRVVGREVEALFLAHSAFIARTVDRVVTGLNYCRQRLRPGRSYPRESRQPRPKWPGRQAG